MENMMNVMTWEQFVESGFDGRTYHFPDFEGVFEASIACTRWDKKGNLLVYLDLDDGRKIVCGARQKDAFFGLEEIPVGSIVQVTFQTVPSTGKSYLRKVELE